MTSWERVRRATSFLHTDRVPMHMNASPWLMDKLKVYLGVTTDKELLDALHIDTWDMRGIDIHNGTMPDYVGPENHPTLHREWKGNIVALWGLEERTLETSSGTIYSLDRAPLRHAEKIEELEEYGWPEPDWFDFSGLKPKLEPWKDRYIIDSGLSVWQHPSFLRGLDALLIDMVEDPRKASFLFDRFLSFYGEFFGRMLREAGDLIEALSMADDLGTQS